MGGQVSHKLCNNIQGNIPLESKWYWASPSHPILRYINRPSLLIVIVHHQESFGYQEKPKKKQRIFFVSHSVSKRSRRKMAGIIVVFDFDKTIIDCDSDNWVIDELGFTDLFNQLLPTMPWNSLMVLVLSFSVRGIMFSSLFLGFSSCACSFVCFFFFFWKYVVLLMTVIWWKIFLIRCRIRWWRRFIHKGKPLKTLWRSYRGFQSILELSLPLKQPMPQGTWTLTFTWKKKEKCFHFVCKNYTINVGMF